MSLKQKTLSGVSWNLLDKVLGSGFTFLIGIVLARLLSPEDFGLIGMTTVIFTLAKTFIDSGFSTGLIRKDVCTEKDYNTVFYYNLTFSFTIYGLIFLLAPYIASFFNEPTLKVIIYVLGSIVVIDSISIIQTVVLTRNIDFKKQAQASLFSSLIGGSIGIFLAFSGYGVWSLVYQILIRQLVYGVVLWFLGNWRPSWLFSKTSFKQLFGFSNKILLSSLIATIQNNIYYLVLGRAFSTAALGYYTRAEQFNGIVTTNLSATFSKVFLPVLSSIQTDKVRLKENLRKINKSGFFLSMLSLTLLAAMAKPIIIILVGVKWETSILYLQLICLGSIFLPLNLLNQNVLLVKGRSDLVFKLQIIKMALLVPSVLAAIWWGIPEMLMVRIFMIAIATGINAIYTDKLIGYSIKDQLVDVKPYFLTIGSISFLVYLITYVDVSYAWMLFLQLIFASVSFLLIFEKQKLDVYLELKQIVVSVFKSKL